MEVEQLGIGNTLVEKPKHSNVCTLSESSRLLTACNILVANYILLEKPESTVTACMHHGINMKKNGEMM